MWPEFLWVPCGPRKQVFLSGSTRGSHRPEVWRVTSQRAFHEKPQLKKCRKTISRRRRTVLFQAAKESLTGFENRIKKRRIFLSIKTVHKQFKKMLADIWLSESEGRAKSSSLPKLKLHFGWQADSLSLCMCSSKRLKLTAFSAGQYEVVWLYRPHRLSADSFSPAEWRILYRRTLFLFSEVMYHLRLPLYV